MKTNQALQLVGGLSRPSKIPGWCYGLPAAECKTGSKLQKVKGSTCSNCYALKGCYVFKVVQAAQYRRLKSIKNPGWVSAMAFLINSKKSKYFRWHDSGDVQDLDHLNKIFKASFVCISFSYKFLYHCTAFLSSLLLGACSLSLAACSLGPGALTSASDLLKFCYTLFLRLVS